MNHHQTFLHFLNKFLPISQTEYNHVVSPHVETRMFEKKTTVLRAGETENFFNFIFKGLVRKFYLRGQEEINTQISVEGHIIHSQESFHSRTPSEYTVETIEPSVLLSITYNDLEKIYTTSHKMEHLGRIIITKTMVLKDIWQSRLIRLTPRERFIDFVNKHQEMMQRVPQKYLASYLNIQPETFSRFKHLIKSKNFQHSHHLH